MTNDHPITPPPELFKQWNKAALSPPDPFGYNEYLAIQAARWGADQQLTADAKWLDHNALNEPHLRITPVGEALKEAMRPKPPSLAEEALAALNEIEDRYQGPSTEEILIRAALERLKELEQSND